MQGKIGIAGFAKAVDSGVGPEIGPVAAVPAEFDIVDMPARSRLEDEDQFVLRPVERSHAAVGLGPD